MCLAFGRTGGPQEEREEVRGCQKKQQLGEGRGRERERERERESERERKRADATMKFSVGNWLNPTELGSVQ